MKHLTISILALSTLALAGCSEQSRTALEPDQALFARPGSGDGTTTEGTDPMTIWDWRPMLSNGTTGTLIQGDGFQWVSKGNEKFVVTGTTGAYEGGVCGVRAKIFWSGTNYGGDAVFDPDLDMKGSKCGPRSIQIKLGDAPVSSEAPFMNVFAIMDAELEKPRPQWLRIINRSDKACERLQWGTQTADTTDAHWAANDPGGIVVTRIAGTAAKRGNGKWRVETVFPHTATCYVWSQGAYQPVPEKTYTLPFHVIITELESTGPDRT